ncbi:M56 family metallopeptidase [Leucobacter sp. GX24907]
MSAATMTMILSGVLILAALGGPWVVRQAAPALASAPRLASVALTATALLWITALVALGPVVAWMSHGPAWLPQQAAEICDRCLSAASPFGESAVTLGVPAIVPLALPALGMFAVLAGLLREYWRVRRSQAALARTILSSSETAMLLGRRVRITGETRPHAFSLPHRHGGIVLSRGAVAALSTAELDAVLEHEQAHLDQRHHLCLTILNGATRYFRWIPFIRAIRDAVPHYCEIAADEVAKRRTGTTALAGALVKLSQPGTPETSSPIVAHAALHAAGSERIRQLLGQPRPPASLALAAAAAAYAFMLAAAIAAVHWPYLLALLTGC